MHSIHKLIPPEIAEHADAQALLRDQRGTEQVFAVISHPDGARRIAYFTHNGIQEGETFPTPTDAIKAFKADLNHLRETNYFEVVDERYWTPPVDLSHVPTWGRF